MSSIGEFMFLVMEGILTYPSYDVEIIDRAGVDGFTYRKLGLKSRDSRIFTVEGIKNLSVAENREVDYVNLKGELVEVIDDFGYGLEDVLVVDVRMIHIQNVLIPVPKNNDYLVKAVWLLRY